MATADGSSRSSQHKHHSSSYNNTCVRRPVGSTGGRPLACFERPVSNIRFEEEKPTMTMVSSSNRRCRQNSSTGKTAEPPSTMDNGIGSKSTSMPRHEPGEKEEKGVFCMADFFESIPDYNDINHLSEHEFYGKLDGLKRKQAELNEACFRRHHGATIRYGTVEVPPLMAVNSCDEEAICSPVGADGDRGLRRSARRSKSLDSGQQSMSSPFRMTQREEEQRILRELMLESRCAFRTDEPNSKQSTRKSVNRKTHKIPATSKYPMYDQIVADQEKRSQLVKLNSMLELQSKIKPFHFATDKPPLPSMADTEPLHSGHLYTPTPDPFAYQAPAKSKRFRARACPRKLFSNYFYHKMWEEEQFRSLNRRLRADEMLQMATTPPSMRKHRKKTAFHGQCTASDGTTTAPTDRSQSVASSHRGRKRSGAKRTAKRSATSNSCGPNFVTTGTHPFRFETTRRSANRKGSTPADDSITTASLSTGRAQQFLQSTPVPIYPAARPNLAANLRAEWSRKKICDLTCGVPAETRAVGGGRSESRQSWGVRKMPGWKSLYYDHSNDEDISLRLSTRRAEERLRNEEHAISMELMRQRVRATPLLLEGATVLPTTATAGIHRLRCDVMPVGHAACQRRQRGSRVRSGSAGAAAGRGRCGRSTAETVGTDGFADSAEEI